MRKLMLLALLAALSMLLVSACSQKSAENPEDLVGGGTPVPIETPVESNMPVLGNDVKETDVKETEVVTETEVTENDPAAESVKEFKIMAKQFSFEPETIEVSKGDKVRLIVTSIDVPHGFSIKEYGINERLDVGKPVTIEFTADKEGSFTAFCSVFCGSGHSNMKGKLIVK